MLPKRFGWLILLCLMGVWVWAQQSTQWPGITTPDDKPNGCVDCHKVGAKDLRLSVTLKNWAAKGSPKEVVTIAQAVFPRSTTLLGKHPDISEMLTSGVIPIPGQCINCHKSQGRPITSVIHLIHLSQNPDYVMPGSTLAQRSENNCTSCHAMNIVTGAITIKGGTER